MYPVSSAKCTVIVAQLVVTNFRVLWTIECIRSSLSMLWHQQSESRLVLWIGDSGSHTQISNPLLSHVWWLCLQCVPSFSTVLLARLHSVTSALAIVECDGTSFAIWFTCPLSGSIHQFCPGSVGFWYPHVIGTRSTNHNKTEPHQDSSHYTALRRDECGSFWVIDKFLVVIL